ncbi:TPA: hypothetical protein ACFPBL_002103, partial [Neisseria meningitidis]
MIQDINFYLVCRTHCNPYSLFDIDSKYKPDEKDKIFFSIPTDNTDFYKGFYLNKDYIEGIYPSRHNGSYY